MIDNGISGLKELRDNVYIEIEHWFNFVVKLGEDSLKGGVDSDQTLKIMVLYPIIRESWRLQYKFTAKSSPETWKSYRNICDLAICNVWKGLQPQNWYHKIAAVTMLLEKYHNEMTNECHRKSNNINKEIQGASKTRKRVSDKTAFVHKIHQIALLQL